MSTIGNVRVSTDEQTTENQQRQTVERYQIDKWLSMKSPVARQKL